MGGLEVRGRPDGARKKERLTRFWAYFMEIRLFSQLSQ
jgi:hypothetical protein